MGNLDEDWSALLVLFSNVTLIEFLWALFSWSIFHPTSDSTVYSAMQRSTWVFSPVSIELWFLLLILAGRLAQRRGTTEGSQGTTVSLHSAPAPLTQVSTSRLLMWIGKDFTTQLRPVITVATRDMHYPWQSVNDIKKPKHLMCD